MSDEFKGAYTPFADLPIALGDVEGGLVAIRRPVAELEDQGANVWVPEAQLLECELCAELGRAEEAARLEECARRLIVDLGQGYYLSELHRVAARRLALSGGPPERVEERLREGVLAARDQGASGHEMPVATDLGRHLMANGRDEEARQVVDAVDFDEEDGRDTMVRRDFDALRSALDADGESSSGKARHAT